MGHSRKAVPAQIKECRRRLADLLGERTLDLKPVVSAQQIRRFELRGNNQVVAFADKREYSVFRLVDTGQEVFWISVSLSYSFDGSVERCDSISIVILTGLSSTQYLPVVRAEWGGGGSGMHAQPHWHAYPVNGQSDDAASIAPMHLAMSAQWHTVQGEDSHQCELAEDSVARWVVNCVTYVKAQLEYMSRKRRN